MDRPEGKEKKAIEELRNYKGYKVKAQNLREKIRALDEVYGSGISYDNARVDSGQRNSVENNVITRIGRKEELEGALKITLTNIAIIERALDNLTDEERKVLLSIYSDRTYGALDRMAMEIGTSRTNIHNIRTAALKKFSLMITC